MPHRCCSPGVAEADLPSDPSGLHVVTVWQSRAHQERWAAEQLFPVFAEPGLPNVPTDSEFTEYETGELYIRGVETGHSSIEHKESPDSGTTSDRRITRRSPFEWQQAAARTDVCFLCTKLWMACVKGCPACVSRVEMLGIATRCHRRRAPASWENLIHRLCIMAI